MMWLIFTCTMAVPEVECCKCYLIPTLPPGYRFARTTPYMVAISFSHTFLIISFFQKECYVLLIKSKLFTIIINATCVDNIEKVHSHAKKEKNNSR